MIIATVTGNLGEDAKVREHDGRKFLSFSVASNTRDKDSAIHTDWIRCTYNGAEKLAEHLKKGRTVTVVGEIKTSIYNNAVQYDMRCMNVELVGGKKE